MVMDTDTFYLRIHKWWQWQLIIIIKWHIYAFVYYVDILYRLWALAYLSSCNNNNGLADMDDNDDL